MESASCYHINFFSFLTALDYHVVILNPLLISNYVKLQLWKTKTDKKDALVIAKYLLGHGGSLSKAAVLSDIADLRDLARQGESLLSQMTALKCDVKRILAITFPELEHMVGVFTKSMLRLLSHFPSAHVFAKARPTDIAKVLITESKGRTPSLSVKAILKVAESSIWTLSPSQELILGQKASILIHLEEQLQELTDLLIELSRSSMDQDIQILTSIPGIGDKTAMNFLVEVGGDIQHFTSHRKLIAMAGIDPAVY
jgi:transposase